MNHLLFALHIPDGLLSIPICALTWGMSLAFLAICLKKTQDHYQEKTIPLMGVCSAFIFSAQMINFPIVGGTSGHLLGGTLAGILLGPWAGSLVISVVFVVQAIFFKDGGITVLGANMINMGLIGTIGGYYLYRSIRFLLGRNHWKAMSIATAIASWSSVVLASISAGLQLAFSGIVSLKTVLFALVGWHLIIGIGEAIITVLTVSFIWKNRPDLFYDPPRLYSEVDRPLFGEIES